MQALVLVGGEGTRLRPLTLTAPKPAVTLVDRPFIGHMVDWLARHGVSEIVMACGFRAADLRAALGEGGGSGPAIAYLQEDEPLGTAGPIRLAHERGLLGERFLVLNGDVLTDLDLTELTAAHARTGAVASLGLYPVDDPSSYGLVRRDRESGAVTEFLEKPDPAEIDTDEINAGCYVLERAVAELIPAGRKVSIEREIFPRLVGQGLFGCRLPGYWMDIGTPERYLQASWDILEGTVRTDVGERASEGVVLDASSSVAAGAEVAGPSFAGAMARIEPGARLGPRAVLAENAVLGEDAVLEGSVALAGARIGAGARVSGAILAPGVEVGAGAVIEAGAIVGEGAAIPPGEVVAGEARVAPTALPSRG